MQRMFSTILTSGLVLGTLAANTAQAHLKMLKPAPWLNEGDGVLGLGAGDPQKGGPCGPGGFDDVQPVPVSGKVTEFHAGETITVEWTETIPHPGWFRIALAQNRADLKDPEVQIDGSCNVQGQRPMGAHGNVLADGLFLKNDYSVLKDPYTYQVTLPNTPCDKCTLQLIQFMEDHAPGCIYYHCADIKILPATGQTDAGLGAPSDGGSGDAGVTGGTTDSGSTGGNSGGTTGSASGTAGGSTPGLAGGSGLAGGTGVAGGGASGGGVAGTGTGGAGGSTGGGTATGGTSSTAGGVAGGTGGGVNENMGDDGCDCSVASTSPKYGNLVGMTLLALGLLARRRRMHS